MKPGNVLMVCLGNICRSPLAQGIFEKYLNRDSYKVDSAATANFHTGASPDPRSIAVAKKHHIDIATQKARQFTAADFDRFDYIYVMDQQNLTNVLKLCKNNEDRKKVALLLDPHEVEDPYYGGENGFEMVFQKIDQGVQKIINQWEFE